jgi:hypothetical protein
MAIGNRKVRARIWRADGSSDTIELGTIPTPRYSVDAQEAYECGAATLPACRVMAEDFALLASLSFCWRATLEPQRKVDEYDSNRIVYEQRGPRHPQGSSFLPLSAHTAEVAEQALVGEVWAWLRVDLGEEDPRCLRRLEWGRDHGEPKDVQGREEAEAELTAAELIDCPNCGQPTTKGELIRCELDHHGCPECFPKSDLPGQEYEDRCNYHQEGPDTEGPVDEAIAGAEEQAEVQPDDQGEPKEQEGTTGADDPQREAG